MALLDSVAECLLFIDTSFHIRWANKRVEEVMGVNRDEIIGERCRVLPHHRHENCPHCPVRNMLDKGLQKTEDVVYPDGHVVRITARPVHDSSGKLIGTIESGLDISPLKKAEIETEKLRGELEHIGRVHTLGQLAASLAHEINQPLAAMLSNAQAAQRLIARDEVDMEEVGEILTDIVEDDRRASEVILRMRALLRRDSADTEAVDINELVSHVLLLLRSELLERNVEMRSMLSSKLPLVMADRVQIQQVLLNLITNAADAMKAQTMSDRWITVFTHLLENGTVEVIVRDNGPGLAKEDCSKIFEPFYTTKAEGLGMGLAICGSIIKAHGSVLRAENNNPDRGLSMRFALQAMNENRTD